MTGKAKSQQDYIYDVALSYTSENREYVEEVATFLKEFGIRVFYDKFETVDSHPTTGASRHL